jgi:hypothetical protein
MDEELTQLAESEINPRMLRGQEQRASAKSNGLWDPAGVHRRPAGQRTASLFSLAAPSGAAVRFHYRASWP